MPFHPCLSFSSSPPHTRNLQMAHRFSMMHDNVTARTMKDVSEKWTSTAFINRRGSKNMFPHPRPSWHTSRKLVMRYFVNGSVMNLEDSFFLLNSEKIYRYYIFPRPRKPLLTDSIVSRFVLEKKMFRIMRVDREKVDHEWVLKDKERERKRDFRKILFHQQLFSYLAETIGRSSVVK